MLCSGPYTPLKVYLPVGVSALPSNTWFPGLTQLSIPNGISHLYQLSHLAALTTVTDRQTMLLSR